MSNNCTTESFAGCNVLWGRGNAASACRNAVHKHPFNLTTREPSFFIKQSLKALNRGIFAKKKTRNCSCSTFVNRLNGMMKWQLNVYFPANTELLTSCLEKITLRKRYHDTNLNRQANELCAYKAFYIPLYPRVVDICSHIIATAV